MRYVEVPRARGKKRKRHDMLERDGFDGVSQFKSQAGDPQSPACADEPPRSSHVADESWERIGKNGKHMSKKHKKHYPKLTYSDFHHRQTMTKLHELQGLFLYTLADGPAPQFVSVQRHRGICKAVVLLVPGLESSMFDASVSLSEHADVLIGESSFPVDTRDAAHPQVVTNNYHANRYQHKKPQHPDQYSPSRLDPSTLPPALKPLADIFDHVWPIQSSGDDRMRQVHSPLHTMLQSPIPKTRNEKHVEKFKKGPQPVGGSSDSQGQKTRISTYVSTPAELLEDEYILHPSCWTAAGLDADEELERRQERKQDLDHGWRDSDAQKIEEDREATSDASDGLFDYTDGRQVFAIDCEMCTVQGGTSALTRISVLNWKGEKVMDELVRPDLPIIDYLTPYSGITPLMLVSVSTTLSSIQDTLLDLITPSTILIGHSLQSDLQALRITHPHIIDTSLLYPHPRGPPMKSSLKYLAQKYLGREIQKGHGSSGHDSIEDARAVLDLLKLKCEKGPTWGTWEASTEPVFRRLKRSDPKDEMQGRGSKQGCIIDWGDPASSYGKMADYAIGCQNDDEVVAAMQRAINGDEDGIYIPGGGVMLTWARMRELEELRGWRNDLPTAPQHISQATPTESATSPTETLASALTTCVARIQRIYAALPPCTLLIVYSGTGDPRPMRRMQDKKRHFDREFKNRGRKWDELTPEERWTDTDEQLLVQGVRRARDGVGFVCVK